MTGPDFGPLGEGWTARTSHDLAHETHGGFVRRVERTLVFYRHELGGHALAVYHRPLAGGEWRLVEATAWTSCTDPTCRDKRGFAHTLTEPESISGDELRWLTTDQAVLPL
jgi:hypothetical protein